MKTKSDIVNLMQNRLSHMPYLKLTEYWRNRNPVDNYIYEGVVAHTFFGFGYFWFVQKYPNMYHVLPEDLIKIEKGFTFTRVMAVHKIDNYLRKHPELRQKDYWR